MGWRDFNWVVLCLTFTIAVVSCRFSSSNPSLRNEDPVDHFEVFHLDFERVEVPYAIGLWILTVAFIKIVYHKATFINKLLPESSVLILIGILIGLFFFFVAAEEWQPTTLTPDIFFLFLLPPIIGEAGYFMPNRLFFDQLGTILLMAVVGTIFNMFTIGGFLYLVGMTGLFQTGSEEYCSSFTNEINETALLFNDSITMEEPIILPPECTDPGLLETFLFGSLIAAVDPVAVLAVFDEIKVDEVLNIVVFGESLLNDGVAVVLYHMFQSFCQIGLDNVKGKDVGLGIASFAVVAGGGTLIGITIGYICAFVTRFLNHARVIEPLVVLIFAYLAYLTAETFEMSGILSITFCGITMKNYVEQNISKTSSTTIRASAHMFANMAEMMIFLFVGVFTVTGTVDGESIHEWNWWFVVMTILACIVFRVMGVLILAFLANRFRIKKLNWTEQLIMMYGGLRGGVAFALVLLIKQDFAPHAKIFVTTTLAMVYWTVFVQGITIKPVVLYFRVKKKKEAELCLTERITNRVMDKAKEAIEDILGDNSEIPIRFRNWYKAFDEKVLKPLLLRENQSTDPKLLQTFYSIRENDAKEYIKRQTTILETTNDKTERNESYVNEAYQHDAESIVEKD